MHIKLQPAKYVVAVSGGVDSIVLLDVLSKLPNVELVVAHYDHGIRADSDEDAKLVASLATQYGLEFFSEAGKLGTHASEALARERRYEFLNKIQQQTKAKAVITAHHEDDRLETAVLNLLRGTGRRGLSSLQSREDVVRPLLQVPKSEIIAYAKNHSLAWREDSTNADEKYLRNYIRRQILPKFSVKNRQQLLEILNASHGHNRAIDHFLTELLAEHASPESLSREWFIGLPHDLSREVLLAWLRQAGIRGLGRRQVERTVVLAKTLPRGKLVDIDAAHQLKIGNQKLALTTKER